MQHNKKLILENGEEYYGFSFGAEGDVVAEIVFNTSMVGYQEILSDPSYTYQAVVMTYPLIGNYGMADEDYETETPTVSALIVREYNDEPSNFRSRATLSEVMKKYGVVGIHGVDTRKLTRSIRNFGSQKALLTGADTSKEEGLKILSSTALPTDAVAKVSRKQPTFYPAENPSYHVVAIDCGMKENILRSLLKKGCSVTVVPWNTTAEEIERYCPDGIFLSNGPGDPTDVPETIKTVKALFGRYPVFGICLGHQILALSQGAKTYKLKFGHRGGNHSVRNLTTERIEITSQNHSFAVDENSLQGTGLQVTHRNLLDNTVEGLNSYTGRAFSVQYHPESAPGPQDSAYLFDQFIALMEEGKHNA